MNSTGILIAFLAGYYAFIIFGSKIFGISRGILASWGNLVLAVLLLVYTIYTGMLQDSPILMVAFAILIIGSILRIVKSKKEINAS